jgi:8-hydroxy-5-deazaflavin:NADPH oxidoreductase
VSTTPAQPVIGIFGAGKAGTAITHLAVTAGYTVHIASSGTATDAALITRYFAPGAMPADGHHLPRLADILVIAVPLRASGSSRSRRSKAASSSTS